MGTTIDAVALAGGHRRRTGALGLADRAARDALAGAELDPAAVDLLINAGLYHDRNLGEPALAALIQEDVGANPEDPHPGAHGTFSFDVRDGAAGVLTALELADGFLATGTARHAVVVAGDAEPGARRSRNFPYDPAGAAVVCGWDEGDRGLLGFRWLTEPAAAGLREAAVRHERGRNVLSIREDPAFAGEAAACAAKATTQLLADLDLGLDDVDAVAAAPFDRRFTGELAGRLGILDERMIQPDHRLRLHTAGLIAALAAALDDDRPVRSRRVLLVAAGAGITAGAALLVR